MVWAHTRRAEQRLELLYLAKEMWCHVERGFPHAVVAAFEFQIATGHKLIVRDDFLQVPQGIAMSYWLCRSSQNCAPFPK